MDFPQQLKDIIERYGNQGMVKRNPTTWTENDFRANAHLFGFDPFKLKFAKNLNDLNEKARKELLGVKKNILEYSDGSTLQYAESPAAMTNLENGEITIFFEGLFEGSEKGTLAHEIYHVYFKNAWDKMFEEGFYFEDIAEFVDAYTPDILTSEYRTGILTDYADTYYHNYMNHPDKFYNFATEVISEMASKQEETGQLVGSKGWKALFQLVTKYGK